MLCLFRLCFAMKKPFAKSPSLVWGGGGTLCPHGTIGSGVLLLVFCGWRFSQPTCYVFCSSILVLESDTRDRSLGRIPCRLLLLLLPIAAFIAVMHGPATVRPLVRDRSVSSCSSSSSCIVLVLIHHEYQSLATQYLFLTRVQPALIHFAQDDILHLTSRVDSLFPLLSGYSSLRLLDHQR